LGRKIYVPMPETEMYARTVSRDKLVETYGEATVTRAESAVVMNLLYLLGMIKPSEFIDAVVAQCRRIEDKRRADARLDSDRG
jgi:hypothetical protein